MNSFDEVRKFYQERGIGARVGFGKSPMVLVVDMTNGFTDPHTPIGADLPGVVEQTRRILAAARERRVPIIFTSIAYHNPEVEGDVWVVKAPALKMLRFGTPWVEVDERLERREEEHVIYKAYTSSFAGTDLLSRLRALKVDTILLCGVSTSGCIRASAVDAVQSGFRCIVAEEAVGDRAELPHLASLLDMDSKYADVVPVSEVLSYLASLKPA